MERFSIAHSSLGQVCFALFVGFSLLSWTAAPTWAAEAKSRPELTGQEIQRLLFSHTYGLYRNGSRIGTTWRLADHTTDRLGGPPNTYIYRHVIEETGRYTAYHSSYFDKDPPYRLVSREIEFFVSNRKAKEIRMVPEGNRWKVGTRTREGEDTRVQDNESYTLSDALAWHAWGLRKPSKGATLGASGFNDNEASVGQFPSEVTAVSNQTILGQSLRVITIGKMPSWANLFYDWTVDVDEMGRITRVVWLQGVEERLER